MCNCPHCGKKIKAVQGGGWTAKAQAFRMRGENAAALEALPPEPRYAPIQPGARIETPVAQQNMESSVRVPLAQSLVDGAFFFCMSTCVTWYIGLPKPLLIVVGVTSIATYRAWKGGVSLADSLLTRIEDYTGVDWNRDNVTGSERKPAPELRFISVRGKGKMSNLPTYEPTPQEQYVQIPGMPRSKENEDPWTVERLTDVLERAFVSGRWGRAHHKELGMSQGQWSVLSKYLSPDKDGNGFDVWGTDDRPTLDAFVEQIIGDVPQPTGSTNQPE